MSKKESELRLEIQDIIDNNKLNVKVLCNGNGIVSYKRTIKEYEKYKKAGTLDRLSDHFYKFLTLDCNDIAHYNKLGYIDYYDNDFNLVQKEVIDRTLAPRWKTDVIKILNEIQSKVRVW